ncbi:MAG: hypothetical protein AAF960_17825 [Bacteroidota bacterium]
MNQTLLNILCFCCLFFFGGKSSVLANNLTTKSSVPQKANTIFQTLSADELITINLKVNLDSVLFHKKTNKYLPAQLTYLSVTGQNIQTNIKVKARGRSRRKYCDFPPLKIKFDKEELAAYGISGSHKSLKLVTHCTEGTSALQNVLEEFLAYKMYNELTNSSLKVQLVRINYQDSESATVLEKYAFLIEDIDELAERLGGKEVEGFGKEMEQFDTETMNIFATFQFMIGNEDWRLPFMRNVKFVALNSGELLPIPYDFDASGLVFAKYAAPDRDLQLESVRQRAFMGRFESKEERAEMVQLFNDRKKQIYRTVENFDFMNRVAKQNVIAYLDSFYEIINTNRMLKMAMPLKGREPMPTDTDGDYITSR